MKTGKKIAILFAVFLAAAAVYFVWPIGGSEGNENIITYKAMEGAELPVMYPKMDERRMAPLLGHREEKAVTAERDSLLVLAEDRKLHVDIEKAGDVVSLGYEIRSLDAEHLVERTEMKEWEKNGDMISAVLPIQNLMEKEKEYQLGIRAGLKDGSEAWYYSRIIETDGTHAKEMLALAEEFSRKTFHYEEAQDLTIYMETAAGADNSSFGTVTLKNSFTQVTWGSTGMDRASEPRITLKELDGELACVQLEYETFRKEEDGSTEEFSVTENFTMKWTAQRIYMMDYERRVNEIFRGERDLFSGKRITLGISDGEDLYTVKSDDGKHVTFVNNRELWAYNAKDGAAILVFSFAGNEKDGGFDPRYSEDRHGIEILNVADNGDIDFLVYGYMNRGNHEGWTGISYHRYLAESNVLEEEFFLPVAEPFEELKEDVASLAYVGDNGNFYLYLDGTIYGVDMSSREYVVIASGLTKEHFAISDDSSRLTWQESTGLYDSGSIYMMDLDTGNKTRIGGEDDESYRVLGFVGKDCVYGVAEAEDYVMSNGRIMGLYLSSLEIVDENMENAMHYEKSGYHIRDVEVDDSRIHISRVREKENGFFAAVSEDTLVCNAETLPDRTKDIGWYVSNVKGRVYFVQLSSDIPAGQKIRFLTPKKIVTDTVLTLSAEGGSQEDAVEFYAYGRGRCLGIYSDFSEAVQTAYENMGFVSLGANDPIWSRVNKPNAYFMRDVQKAMENFEAVRESFTGTSRIEDGVLMLEASGTALNQILYFVGTNTPVLVNTGNGTYQYLTGYDQGHVRIWDPVTAQSETMTLESAKEKFERLGNDFICCIYTD